MSKSTHFIGQPLYSQVINLLDKAIILYVDIEFRAEYLLYTLKMSIGKPKEPLGSLEYKKNIYKVDDLSWCDKYYIKGIVQAMFADMIIKHIELSWGT